MYSVYVFSAPGSILCAEFEFLGNFKYIPVKRSLGGFNRFSEPFTNDPRFSQSSVVFALEVASVSVQRVVSVTLIRLIN